MISVCLAVHNGEKYIKPQLVSILKQLGKGDEVIISDDGSTDNSKKLIESLNDYRINVYDFKQPLHQKHSNVYAAKNFENALVHAGGDYIFLCDQDDIWYDTKVAKCMEYLQSYDLVQHNLMEVNNEMQPLSLHFKNGFRRHNYMVHGNSYHGCAMAFKRSVLNYALPFPDKLPLHDYWIGILVESKGKVHYMDEPLVYYRVHGNNISLYNSNSLSFKIGHRLYIIYNLILRLLTK